VRAPRVKKRRTKRTRPGPGPRKAAHRRQAAVSDCPVGNEFAVAKSSVIGHLFAVEEGVRSPVRRDDAVGSTGGNGKCLFVFSQRLGDQIGVARRETRAAYEGVAPK